MTKETSYTFDVLGTRHLFNSINFSFINFNTSFRNFVPQDNTFINHKVALLPIQDKISIFTSLQICKKVVEVIIKNFSVYGTSIEDCLSNLDRVLQRCEDTNL